MSEKIRGVFLDTEAFFHDLQLDKPAFALLRAHVRNANECAMLVSEVVFLEVVNHYRKRVQKAHGEFNSALTESKGFFPDLRALPNLKEDRVNELVHEYQRKLRAVLIDGYGAHLLPFPRLSHKKVMERHIARQKPFDENGRGYGDTLIWLSLVDFLRKERLQSVAFVSKNYKDFASKDSSTVAMSLQQDLEHYGIRTDVSYFSNISAVMRDFFNVKLDPAKELETQSEWHIELVSLHRTEILEGANSDLDSQSWKDRITIEELGEHFTILTAESQALSDEEATVRLGIRFWKSRIMLWRWDEHWDTFTTYNADVDCWLEVLIERKMRTVKSFDAEFSDVFKFGSPLSQRRERLT